MSELQDRLTSALGDRYEFERELGAGGMATVYLACDVRNQRHVAIKVFRPDLAHVLGGERFLCEIEMVAQIEHPHLLTLIDSGEADGILYYVMPYVRGESLRDRLTREGKLPVGDAVRMLRDVADGLAEAHRHGLVHRDIKPENVMISGNHAVVMDFGVAKAVSTATGRHQMTTVGVALGTPSYMSPEQATADPNIDHRSDIYALGAMGYELLAGRPPFVRTTSQEILAAHLTAVPDAVTEHRPETPPALDAILSKCLEKLPDDRWQQMDDVLRQLEVITTPSGGVPSMKMPAASPAGQPSRLLRPRNVAIAAVILVAAGGLFVQQRQAAATRVLVAEIQGFVESDDLDSVYEAIEGSGRNLSDGSFASIADVIGGSVSVETDPVGAAVQIARGNSGLDSLTAPVDKGRSPLSDLTLVAGEYRLTIEADGFLPAAFALHVEAGTDLQIHRTLVAAEWDAEGMVVVAGGVVPGPLAGQFEGSEVPAFLVDRHEVTNQRFMAFVSAGAYRDPSLWPDSMLIDGVWTAREIALAQLVDQTGLPGPRAWSGGTFAEGREDHPVAGITWYEASAFAAWEGKSLPTLEQWWRAALGDEGTRFPWGDDLRSIDDRSNFGGLGTSPVGQFTFGASPYGVHDMAGNVREWLVGEPAERLFMVVGGSWQTPTYMFDSPNIESSRPFFESEEVGFRLVKPLPTP